jgi:flagellar protein FlgJ
MTTPVNLLGAIPSLGNPVDMDTSAATTYTDINGLAALKQDPKSPQAISAVAQQVEALFLQMMLKSMRDATAAEDPDGNEMGMYQDMFDKQVALNISQHADLGIAKLLKRQLTQRAASAAGLGMPSAQDQPVGSTQAEFVDRMLPPIRRIASALNLNPQALLAQAALETGWGQRMPRNSDGSPSNNMFGIKAGEEWSGPRATADTVEVSDGVASTRRTAFRAYGSIEDSVDDFARLLSSSPRYREALSAGSDAQAYFAGIGKSGYATDPQYSNKLNQTMNSDAIQAVRPLRLAGL